MNGNVGKDYTFKPNHPPSRPEWPDTNSPAGIHSYRWSIGGNCFLAGTKITMASGTYKNIENIVEGDIITAYDEINKKATNSEVIATFHHTPDEMPDYYLIVNGQLRVTPNHRMYINNEWKTAGELGMGDKLLNLLGEEVIVFSLEKVYEKVPTYNLEIEKHHNYFAEDILVHNGPKGDYPWWYGSTIPEKTWSWDIAGDYEITLEVRDLDGKENYAKVIMHIS
jgi:hypothetical protein